MHGSVPPSSFPSRMKEEAANHVECARFIAAVDSAGLTPIDVGIGRRPDPVYRAGKLPSSFLNRMKKEAANHVDCGGVSHRFGLRMA